jgi:nucleoside transporter
MNKAVRLRLFFMMSLEFAIWGAWLPQIFSYLPSLGFSHWQQSAILNAFPAAALVAMFFSNQFADRNFAAERFLAFSQLVGGLAIFALAFTTNFWLFFALFLIHCLLYVPTLSIVNSITFAHLKDPKDFGLVRMGGTVGWVAAAWPFTFILVDWEKVHQAHTTGFLNWLGTALGSPLTGEALRHGLRWIFVVAGIASLLLAAFSLTLPHTPPKKAEAEENKFAWLEALRLLSKPFVLVLWVVALVDAFVLNAYFNWAFAFLSSPEVGIAGNWITPIMSIGAVAEILTMSVLGMALKRFGWRLTMLLGILGHVVRFGVFAFFPHATTLIILINLVHGVCYAFFFAAVYIFVDEYFPKDARASAQGLFNVMILGVGVIAANSLCPWMLWHYTSGPASSPTTDFRTLFSIASVVAIVSAAALALFFHPPALKQSGPVQKESVAA